MRKSTPATGVPLTYLTQPFYPSPDFAPGVSSPPLEVPGLGLVLDGGNYVVYLEAWQRSANALEDPHIREVALDGPDTAERIQTVWQVRLLPVADAAGKNLCQAHLSEWKSLLAKNATTAQMNAQAAPPPQNTNKCMLPPSAGFQGLQNQLYRIEILNGGSESEATFIWSRDNGMVETSIVSVNATIPNIVTVTSLGTDDLHSFAINDWVEIVDRDDELSGTKRFLAQIAAPAPDPVSKQITLSRSVPQPYLDGINFPPVPTTNYYRLKRWDMSGTGVTADGIQISPNTWMPIEEGVQVWFGDGHYAERAGGDSGANRRGRYRMAAVPGPQHRADPAAAVRYQPQLLPHRNDRQRSHPVDLRRLPQLLSSAHRS